MDRLAAIILAAGVSIRKGRFKPMLPLGNLTIIQSIVNSVREVGAFPVFVVTGYQSESLKNHLSGSDLVFVHNERYFATQMMDSLCLALAELTGDIQRVLLCPADVPLVKRETIEALLRTEGDFIRPCCQGVPGHPVLLSKNICSALMNYQGDGGLRRAIKKMGIAPTNVPVQDCATTLDQNGRDEYEGLLQYRRRESGTPQPLQLDLKVSLQAETSFWGQECAQFLELIQITGSMLSACQCMHMSYSRGWKMVNEMEHQLGYPLLVRSQGGNNGGGSTLTEAGKSFLTRYQEMNKEIWGAAQMSFQRYFPQNSLGK